MTRRLVSAGAVFSIAAAAAGSARASSGIESPETGVLQAGRGGAWVARADDPLAAYFNPAGLATQSSGVHAGVHLMLMEQCFTRLGPDGEPVPSSTTSPIPAPGTEGGPDPKVCAEGGVFPNPQVAATLRLRGDLAIGLGVLGPHGVGSRQWPESVPYTHPTFGDTTQPSPQRYLVTSNEATILLPTLSAGFSPAPGLSIGAGFVWGIATIEVVNFNESTSAEGGDDFNTHNDLRSQVQAADLFIPGFVLGARWSASDRLDLGAWFKWQDAVRSKTDLTIESRYWTAAGRKNENPCPGEAPDCNVTDAKEAGDLKLQIPMEAKLGLRYHHPRASRGDAERRPAWARSAPSREVRDPMSDDLFDVELDVTWANDSALDAITVRFHEDIAVRGTSVGFVPLNADVPHNWRDVVGVRLGGDLVALPELLAVRAGGFFESKGQDDADLNLDFALGSRVGVGGGATVRVGPVDLSVAFQHTFFSALDNGGKGRIKAVSGSAPSGFRSLQSVNGGRLETSLNEFGLSGTVRF